MTRILGPFAPYIAGLAFTAALGGFWYVAALKVDRDALRAENAALAGSVAALETTLDAERHGQKLAWAAAVQNAADAQAAHASLAAFLKGETCDPTDPVCSVDFINRILRRYQGGLPDQPAADPGQPD